MPPEIFKKLVQELPGGSEVVSYIDGLLAILDESKLLYYYVPEFKQKTIFAIAWDIHSSSGYALFPGILFYHETIKYFSALVKTEPGVFISTLIQSSERTLLIDSNSTKSLLQALLDHFKEERKVERKKEFADESIAGEVLKENTDILPLLNESKIIQQHFEITDKPATVVIAAITDVLRYFLQWNRLPGNFSISEKDEQKKFLREILAMLFSDNLVALRSIIEDKRNATPAKAYLSELFSVAEGGKEKQMAEFLFEVNLPVQHILMEQKEAGNNLTKGETEDFDLLKIFGNDTEIADSITAGKVLEEAKRVFAFFLKYNRLPDDIALAGKGSIEYFLKELILFLFAQDKMFISEQFKNADTAVAAKLYLYDILAISYDIRTSRIKDFMQEIRERDLNELFKNAFEKDPSALIKKILQDGNPETIKDDGPSFLSSASFAKKILDRYGTEMLLKLASLKINWTFTSDSIIQIWLNILQKAIASGLYKEKLLEFFNRFNILFISGRLNIYSNDNYTITFINYLSAQPGLNAGEIFRQLLDHTLHSTKNPGEGITGQYDLMQRMLQPLMVRQNELKTADAEIKAKEEKILSHILKEDIDRYRQQLSESIKKEMQNKTETVVDETDITNKFEPETGESIYIANAGLVLFHPFLETYFSRTGLMENNVFIDESCRHRAVLLLQYLATGNTEHAEHEMVLNKILCNVPLEQAVPVSFEATETEIEVTRELLEVIIERWDKMKNTSPEGFQNSFIMRNGMLNFREDHWNLKVEQRGYDILLQTLPWAFGYIKMSWMQHNLIVEWI
jgi:hypothetical protein